jgi:hypothetical protein
LIGYDEHVKRKRTKAELSKIRREIGARGGAIGGRKRAEQHTTEELRQWASSGGQARAKKLTAAQRREIASLGGQARTAVLTPAALSRIGRKGARTRWARADAAKPSKRRPAP